MLLSEIKEEVITRSGQFILDADRLEVDDPRFLRLVKTALRQLNKYSPKDLKFTIEAGNQVYTFDTGAGDPVVPEWISDVLPLRASGNFSVFAITESDHGTFFGPGTVAPDADLVKRKFAFEYRKPDLFLPFQGRFQVHAVNYWAVTKDANNADEIIGIEVEEEFFNLVLAYFLQALGRFRRAFTLNEVSVEFDAAQLVDEGSTLEEKTIEAMADDSKFYLAWRG